MKQTAKIAANCARSLLLQPKPTPADHSLARHLLPRVLAFATNTEPEDPERARSLVCATLSAFVGVVPSASVPVAMALVIPALLSRAASEEGQAVYRETSARLLELASANQAAFRGVVAGMSEGQRAFLEEVIRAGRQTGGPVDDEEEEGERPTIALKMNFGG